MATQGDFTTAMTNRSLRTIRALSSILSQLPDVTQLHAPVSQAQSSAPAQTSAPTPAYSPPTSQLANTSLNEKTSVPSQNQYPSTAPPPSYAQSAPVLSIASALYAYTPTDAGDLALQPHDRIQVLEHMNNDWWRGRNERTNLEGIFPRSYVTVLDEKPAPPVAAPQPTNYGNMPLEVSESGSSAPTSGGRKPSKFEEQGKKFGKKMGNAAIFGAGATIGSNIVNSIF
ncbi:SH3 domain protein [Rasamsonia emersonii CBS 393.64]|uniref:SH3 domain protein n=1 Tax=Rasamsonia emersonii (strain ATCC 16479 / CBS 393.64 / IMI 116815) TaxID=1408163 RepID=A0A0F4YFK0_RASE3|nr:SH3 domain protein [Rasamsonia emersonii CBS 393.64]KKA16934.1 SH3 domain protein [Rasamsonia emersonii CBS 393.64]